MLNVTKRTAAPGKTTVLLLALICSSLLTSSVESAHVVVPNHTAISEGNSRNIIPFFSNPGFPRYQQVHDANQFGSFGSSLITQVAFRLDPWSQTHLLADFSLEIDLSTTNANSDNISSVFDANIGSDVQTVFSGRITLEATNTRSPNNFDAVINFDMPFPYDPKNGNLLMEIRRPPPVPPLIPRMYFDAVFQNDGIGRVISTGAFPGQGLVARFTIVPEPNAAALALAATLFFAGGRRR